MAFETDDIGMCPAILVRDPLQSDAGTFERVARASAAAGFRELSVWAFYATACGAERARELLDEFGLSVRVIEAVTQWVDGPGDALDHRGRSHARAPRRRSAPTPCWRARSSPPSRRWTARSRGSRQCASWRRRAACACASSSSRGRQFRTSRPRGTSSTDPAPGTAASSSTCCTGNASPVARISSCSRSCPAIGSISSRSATQPRHWPVRPPPTTS